MAHHENKSCQRCGTTFECKLGSITQCQCTAVQLSMEERVYIESKFSDCLCASCLLHLQGEYTLFKEKFIF